jgi:3'-phosphoadenosine 5'-phosphosulfate sulfotransferase (PAPS reductase)/FAD synthetase
MRTPQEILDKAISDRNPVAIVCAYSGGYDSLCLTHLVHTQLDTHGLPLSVWSIDTKLSADGWLEYVVGVGKQFGWNHTIHDNKIGFDDFVKSVKSAGCPYSKSGHSIAYRCLKERSFYVALKSLKTLRSDKVLFLTGIRSIESRDRQYAPEINRIGKSNMIFVSPILYWSDENLISYRLGN